MVHRIKRRRLFALVAAVGLVNVVRSVPAAAQHAVNYVGGTVERLAGTTFSVLTSRGSVRGILSAGATALRVDEDFALGGSWAGETFTASLSEPMFRALQGKILLLTGDRLSTTAGAVRITDRSVVHELYRADRLLGLDALTTGATVGVTARREQGELVAYRIGVSH